MNTETKKHDHIINGKSQVKQQKAALTDGCSFLLLTSTIHVFRSSGVGLIVQMISHDGLYYD